MKGRMLAGAIALALGLTAIAAIATTAEATAPAGATAPATAPATSGTHYYLALGDSLSVGYQPTATGAGRETDQGYVNDIYTAAKRKIKDLKLVQLGCPGETTTSMLTGRGNTTEARLFNCDRTGGSQLTAAERFLKAHSAKGEVPLITLDIGANDVDGCVSAASEPISTVESCVVKGVGTLEANTPKILAAIRKVATRGTILAAMNLYDPVLADELSSDSSEASLGTLSLSLVKTVNAAITKADIAAGFKTANVAKAFGTYDTTPESTTGTSLAATGLGTVPTDVANICDLTWMCAAPPVGPNIHANHKGYARIAQAFEAVLPKAF